MPVRQAPPNGQPGSNPERKTTYGRGRERHSRIHHMYPGVGPAKAGRAAVRPEFLPTTSRHVEQAR